MRAYGIGGHCLPALWGITNGSDRERERETMYRSYARKGWEIIGWTFHADIYCKDCGDSLPDVDPEGNTKHPVSVTDEVGQPDQDTGEWLPEYCGKCGLESGEW